MPAMFVPEEKWAPRSWGINHRLTVRAHREHGLDDAGYGYWGFSPASQPGGGYREYGVDAIGLNPDGYLSDVESTNMTPGTGPAATPPMRTRRTATGSSPRMRCSWRCTWNRGRPTTTCAS